MAALARPEKLPAHPRSNGKRRSFGKAEAIPLQWPTTMKERREMFQTWHDAAMQILHREKVNFRLIALAGRFLNWDSGTFWPTNETLASCGGGCSPATIKREIKACSDVGIFILDRGWRKASDGLFRRTRTIRLSVPKVQKGEIHGVHSGAYEQQIHEVHSGAEQGVHSGAFNTDESLKATGEVEANQIGFGGKEPAASVSSHPSTSSPSGNVSRLAHRREPSADELAAFAAMWRSSQKTGGNP